MDKKIVALMILLSLGLSSFSQKINYLQSNTDTYQKYIQQDWKGLIKSGRLAKRNNIEYYYLNVRMGVAFFEKGQYLLAIPYFEKARKENPKDEFILDYLYYSYLYAGNEQMSLSVYRVLPRNLRKNKNIPSTNLKDVDLTFGYHTNQDYSQLSVADYIESGISDLQVNLDKSMYNIGIGFNFQVSQNTFLYQMFGYRKANFLYIEQNSDDLRYSLSLNEFRYYGKLDFNLEHGWKAILNYNLLFGTSQNLTYVASTGRRTGGYYGNSFFFGNVSTGFSISKQWNRFLFSPHVNIMAYNGPNVFVGSDFVFYPLGNADLYLRSDVSYNPLTNNDSSFVIKAEAGFRLWKFYFTGTYYYGKMERFIEDDGLFIYNFDENVLEQSALTVQFFAKDKTYFASVVPSTYEMTYTDENLSSAPEYSMSYNKLLVKFGIKWKLTK